MTHILLITAGHPPDIQVERFESIDAAYDRFDDVTNACCASATVILINPNGVVLTLREFLEEQPPRPYEDPLRQAIRERSERRPREA